MAETQPKTSVVPSTNPVGAMVEILAPVDMKKVKEAFEKFEEFKNSLLTKEDMVTIKGKEKDKVYLKKSAWRKWALVTGLSDELLSAERHPASGKEDGQFQYRVVVRIYHLPTGRQAIGMAVAASREKTNWAHEEHDILALAHTRAKNRGISDLVGGGEVSAEEMEAEPQTGWVDNNKPGIQKR